MTTHTIKPVDPDDDKPYNAADPRQVRKRADKQKRAADDRGEAFKALLQQPEFRSFLWHLICETCQLYQSPFNPNGSVQSQNIGRQDVGRELFVRVSSVDPKLIITMMTEYSEGIRD